MTEKKTHDEDKKRDDAPNEPFRNNAAPLAMGLGIGLLLGYLFNNLLIGLLVGLIIGMQINARRRNRNH